MSNSADRLTVSRMALGWMAHIPQPVYEQLLETDFDVEKLVSDRNVLGAKLQSLGCQPVGLSAFNDAVDLAHREYVKARGQGVSILTPWQDEYPQRLLESHNYPRVLFKYGECELNPPKTLGVVGTRKCTAYGDSFVRNSIAAIQPHAPRLLIVSGLAFGIDAAGHRAALEMGMPTVGVLAHGFGTIYPAQHRDLAAQIIRQGGCLLSEYAWGEKPYRQRFLERNRIVAALSDYLLVAESNIKGGAMSTANIAFSLNRMVLALPGRISDDASSGCNLLIASQKAQLVMSAEDMMRHMDIHSLGGNNIPAAVLPLVEPELEGESKRIYELLGMYREPVQADVLCARLNMPIAKLTALLGEMEFDGIVTRLAGNRFTIL